MKKPLTVSFESVIHDYLAVCGKRMPLEEYQKKYGANESPSGLVSDPIKIYDVEIDLENYLITSKHDNSLALPARSVDLNDFLRSSAGILDSAYNHILKNANLVVTGQLFVGNEAERGFQRGLSAKKLEIFIGKKYITLAVNKNYQEGE